MLRSLYPFAVAAVLSGCAGTVRGPPAELAAARVAVAQAQASPLSLLAPAALRTAERALWVAEREAQERPGGGSASDAAYVARRRAQCSQLAALVESDRRTLEGARRAAAALRARGAPSREAPSLERRLKRDPR